MFYTKGHLIIKYCINIQGDLSDKDISISRCDNRSNVGANNEDRVDFDKKVIILLLKIWISQKLVLTLH